ncbi:DUF6624 domain-containing protein [Carboxylicivirga sp. N1Y90]|uniref:DUF6624 domain-containing protein n=1 Tax=Carboxylicivirga fragile TaxID=3417571 RepID=UPI003D352506|nr:hypothetical protein [Marinilabiliaceae bacterium N1Y90]
MQKQAKEENCDSVVLAFNRWIEKEQSLDSLQRVFIDKDLAHIREKECWSTIEDSLKYIFFRKNKHVEFKELGYELWLMGAEDQKFRTLSKYVYFPKLDDPEHSMFIEKQLEQTKEATQKVYALIKKYGWLNNELVGKEAARACFYVIQYDAPDIQEECLPYLKTAVEKGKANPYHYAMMYDKMLFVRKGKQLYGTQIRRELGAKKYNVIPIKNEKNVNKRRADLGLRPIEEDLYNKWGIVYKPSSK